MSDFGHSKNLIEVVERIKKNLKMKEAVKLAASSNKKGSDWRGEPDGFYPHPLTPGISLFGINNSIRQLMSRGKL